MERGKAVGVKIWKEGLDGVSVCPFVASSELGGGGNSKTSRDKATPRFSAFAEGKRLGEG